MSTTPPTQRARPALRGILRQWTLDNGTVLRTPQDFEAAMADDVAAGGLDFDILCEAEDHLGQTCELVQVHADDLPPQPYRVLEVRFTDGCTIYAWPVDVWFD